MKGRPQLLLEDFGARAPILANPSEALAPEALDALVEQIPPEAIARDYKLDITEGRFSVDGGNYRLLQDDNHRTVVEEQRSQEQLVGNISFARLAAASAGQTMDKVTMANQLYDRWAAGQAIENGQLTLPDVEDGIFPKDIEAADAASVRHCAESIGSLCMLQRMGIRPEEDPLKGLSTDSPIRAIFPGSGGNEMVLVGGVGTAFGRETEGLMVAGQLVATGAFETVTMLVHAHEESLSLGAAQTLIYENVFADKSQDPEILKVQVEQEVEDGQVPTVLVDGHPMLIEMDEVEPGKFEPAVGGLETTSYEQTEDPIDRNDVNQVSMERVTVEEAPLYEVVEDAEGNLRVQHTNEVLAEDERPIAEGKTASEAQTVLSGQYVGPAVKDVSVETHEWNVPDAEGQQVVQEDKVLRVEGEILRRDHSSETLEAPRQADGHDATEKPRESTPEVMDAPEVDIGL